MNRGSSFVIFGATLLAVVFLGIGFVISQPPMAKFMFDQSGQFKFAFWNLRRLDVMVQIALIFTSSLGVLVFFAEKEKK